MGSQPPNPSQTDAHALRLRGRSGSFTSPTSGLCGEHIQANLLILPDRASARDFQLLCQRNPVPCPLLGISLPGDPSSFRSLVGPAGQKPIPLFKQGEDGKVEFDVRTDLPKYWVYRNGKMVKETTDVMKEWTNQHTAFLIGCSFSFENALSAAGLPPRHWESKTNVPMYNTKRPLDPAGIFTDCHYVVSMRPYRLKDIEKVRDVTRPYVSTHGEPIAWGWDAMEKLGIRDIARPEFGDAVEVREGEVPVFWGCGVTPQAAVMSAGDKIEGVVMGHAPGHMLVLDITDEDILAKEILG